jgi:hypothetical protein
MQYRSGAGKVFELAIAGRPLDVQITPREGSGVSEHWHVTARDDRRAGAIVISGVGATRAEALENVSRAWDAQVFERKLTACDWVAVTSTLQAIRAI